MKASNVELPSADEGFSLISSRKLLTLYSAMLQCRRLGLRSRNGHKSPRPGSAESIAGHEAAIVGAALDLLPHDTVAPALMPDTALKFINPFVSIAPSVSHATRNALANGIGQKLTVLFSSGNRNTHPSWIRALTLAADHNLPILFVSLNRPETSRAPLGFEAIEMKRKDYALPYISVDGNDVVAVYRVASEAIAHARKDHGPTLIDCRLTSPGDPIRNMHQYLVEKGLDPGEPTV
jgi:TPP-dependent pyruvate/acetoin dehydrogenase alpha subunit